MTGCNGCRTLAAIASALWMLLGAIPADHRAFAGTKAPDDAAIQTAIQRGIAFLRDEQSRDGSWRFGGHDSGATALVGLALLENGIPAEDDAVQRAAAFLRERLDKEFQTYDIALALLFFSRAEDNPNDQTLAWLSQLAARLEGGQSGGMWDYQLPQEILRRPGDTGDTRENTDESESHRRNSPKHGDNSNTQFGLLGTWAATRLGFPGNQALSDLDRHFRETQSDNGGWGYHPREYDSPAMTCAGVLGLAIGAARPERAASRNARARGAQLAQDNAFQRGLKALGRDARNINGGTDIYYLWSLERVCVALGLKQLDGIDWYAQGAEELLRRQDRDGGWPEPRWGRLPNSALALLFLRKANLAFELDRVLKLPQADSNPDGKPAVAFASATRTTNEQPPKPAADANASANGGGATVTVRQTDESGFPEITVDFEVKDPNGQPILDAGRNEFRVTEYDEPVVIEKFLSPRGELQERPTTLVLVVDRSGSMREEDRIGALKQAVRIFLTKLPAGSRVALIAFGSDVRTLTTFTNDGAAVQTAVDRLTPSGSTRYYDAVEQALKLLQPETGRRAVLALTDGEDTFSQHADMAGVIALAQKLNLPVFTLGLGSEDEIASDELRMLAEQTRGQYFHARDAEKLKAVYEELAAGLRNTYSLVYRTNRPVPDGTLRPVKLFYQGSNQAAESVVYVEGMVAPVTGWSRLFLALVGILGLLAWLPNHLRNPAATHSPSR